MHEHEHFMRRAIALGQEGMDGNHGGPFGAVVVKDGAIIGEGYNSVVETYDSTGHAEVTAIRAATAAMKNPWLEDCDLYTSCEPCPMCLSATLWSHIRTIFYAGTKEDAAAIGFDDAKYHKMLGFQLDRAHVHMVQLLQGEAAAMMRGWLLKADRKGY